MKYLANSREQRSFPMVQTTTQKVSTNIVLCKGGKMSKVIIIYVSPSFYIYKSVEKTVSTEGFVVFEKMRGK